jgi:hypothetical protein
VNTIERSQLRRDLAGDGAARLLRRLVRDGLPVAALTQAAALVAALEQVAAERRRPLPHGQPPRTPEEVRAAMDVSPELERVIAEHDQELAARAAELDRKMIEALAAIRHCWVELAGYLYEFWRISGWAALGYSSPGEWLAQSNIELSRSQAYRLAQAYREFVVYHGIDPERLGRVDVSKAQLALPAVRSGQVEPERAVADAEALSLRDLKQRYGHRVYEYWTCPECGMRRSRRVEP